MMLGFPKDIRYGIRTLLRNRGFAATALITLALGIGAATAIFSVVEAVLLRPLPYEDPGRLVPFLDDLSQQGYPRARVMEGLPTILEVIRTQWASVSGTYTIMALPDGR
ncbi:MAG: hypothetical protein JO033_01345 [Acidobacteriaceae bacterium]|nr:hypothetical protein [Acidobacteriaceae bacterium]